MATISEEGRTLRVTSDEAAFLVTMHIVARCSDCGHLHHEDYERWAEIDDLLRTRREFFGETGGDEHGGTNGVSVR
jgi:hypothetical protein